MKYQELPYSCGAAALVNSLRTLGIKITEKRARKLAGTTTEGTDEEGICNALKALKVLYSLGSFSDRVDALGMLRSEVACGSPAIVCVQRGGHWVVVAGVMGRKFIVVDSAKTLSNKAENGVTVMEEKELLRTWKSRKSKYEYIVLHDD